jgi:hypothetical protein
VAPKWDFSIVTSGITVEAMYFIGVGIDMAGLVGERLAGWRKETSVLYSYGIRCKQLHLCFSKLAIPTPANDTAHSPGSKHIYGSCSGSGITDVIHPTGSALVCLGKPEFEGWEQEDH